MPPLVRRSSPVRPPLARLLLVVALAPSLGCAGPIARPSASSVVSPQETARMGKTIYFGTVTPLGSEPAPPTFVYERLVAHTEAGVVSTHLTRDPSGQIVLAESATHGADYSLTRYDLRQNQLGQTGSVEIERGLVRFHLRDGAGAERSASEPLREPVVVGPTLVGHIVQHLPDLSAGASSTVRLAVLDRLETIGFRLERGAAAGTGLTRIVMRPTSLLIGLAVDPITFTFDTASSKLVRLEGRVPPKIDRGGRLAAFDARVDYRFVADRYE